MLINAIRAENLKSRHSNMWVAVLILPLLTAAIGAIIYGINASANLYDGAVWQQLWLQTGLFYGYFFFPILIAICASYLWRLEHTNHNWNSLMTTPVSRSTIFIAKLVVLTKSILAAQVLLMVFIIIVGTPLYMGYPREAVVELLLPAFLPFNLLKGGLNASITFLLYKPIVTALRKSGYVSTLEKEARQQHTGLLILASFIIVTCVLIILSMNGVI